MSDNLARKYGAILEQMPAQDRQALTELQLFQRESPLPAGAAEKEQALLAEMRSLGVEPGREVGRQELGRMAGPESPGHAPRDLMARYYAAGEGKEPPPQDLAAKYGRGPAPVREHERGRNPQKEPGE